MEGREFNDSFLVKARQEREQIEKARHSDEVVEAELKQSIYDDVVTIFGIPVIFKEFDIVEDKAVIRMPSDFIARSDDEIASVYFLGSKPQYVFSNGYLNFMLAFHWTESRIPDIVEDKAVIRMPSDFIARSDDEIASVYFLGSKPQYVFSNGYLNFMLAFHWTESRIPEDAVFDFLRFAKQAIERIGPKARILEEERLEKDGQKVAILQMIAQTIDSVNYNIMFFTVLEGRLLIGSLTFEQKYRKRLLPLALEIVKSFSIKKEEEETEK